MFISDPDMKDTASKAKMEGYKRSIREMNINVNCVRIRILN